VKTLAWLPTGPAVESPPPPRWRDWLLAGAIAATAIAEGVLREDLTWRPAAVMVGLALACATLWRRSRPLAMVGLGFGAIFAVDVARVAAGKEPLTLITGASVLVLVYALFRWGTTRQAAAGSAVVLVEWLVSVTTDFHGATDAVFGLALLLLTGAVGTAVRYQRIVRAQQLDRVRFHEREILARELHDTVAHHVSAMAVQAQAGQFLAHTGDQDGAAEALAVIEQEASRALAEMRTMVRTLRRDHGAPEGAPARGVADIETLVTSEGVTGMRVDVDRRGDLRVRPALGDGHGDFFLTLGKGGDRLSGVGGWCGVGEAGEQAGRDTGGDQGVTLGGRPDGVDQQVRTGVLEQETLRAGSERVGDVIVSVEGGDDDDRHWILHVGSGKPARCLDAVEVWHSDVEQAHVGA